MVVTCGSRRVAAMAWMLSSRSDGVEALASPPAPSKRSEASCLAASCPRPAAGAKSIGEGRDAGQKRRARRAGQHFGRRAARNEILLSGEARDPRGITGHVRVAEPSLALRCGPCDTSAPMRQKKNAMLVCVDTLDFGPLWFWRRAIARYLPPLIKRRSQGLASTRLRCRAFARGAKLTTDHTAASRPWPAAYYKSPTPSTPRTGTRRRSRSASLLNLKATASRTCLS